MASDFILIPVQPSPYDVWASADTTMLIREARQFKQDLGAAFTINRKIVNTAIGRDVAEALADYDLPVLETALCQRVVYAESAAQGQTVLEADPNGRAALEIRALARAVLNQDKRAAA
jgi:chromosome partitioning protein